MPITLTLGLTGLLMALSVSIPLGIIAAMREGSLIDKAICCSRWSVRRCRASGLRLC